MAQKKKGKFVPGGFDIRVKKASAGKGLFAFEDIPKGSCLIEYKGRTISNEEAYTSRSRYLFEINSRKTIDGKPKWNKAGYINHSCGPNAEPEIRNARIFIMAIKNIKKGDEITYDYGKEYFDDYLRPHGCRCGSPRCKKPAR